MNRPPLSQRTGNSPDDRFEVLHEGVPPWLRSTLLDWFAGTMSEVAAAGVTLVSRSRLQDVEVALRLDPPLDWRGTSAGTLRQLLERAADDPVLLLDMVDYALGCRMQVPNDRLVAPVAAALQRGGSAWTVIRLEKGYALSRRVDDPTAAVMAAATSHEHAASHHLRAAWFAAFGRNPNPGHAYHEAIQAVEAAAREVVCPNNGSATMSHVIGEMRAHPDAYDCTLSMREAGESTTAVVGMLNLLWKTPHDRHGEPRAEPERVEPEKAEAAVILATSLVELFRSGAIRRRPHAGG